MRPFTSTISLDEARSRLAAAVRPIERTEHVGLDKAHGRVAARFVSSPIDVPPFARSAMDGYAVIAADTAAASSSTPVTLRVLDRIYTGAVAAVGHADVDVFARPRVAVLSTGNEVVEPGTPLGRGQIFDVNRFTLGAIVAAHGGVPEPRRAAEDTIEALVKALDASADT